MSIFDNYRYPFEELEGQELMRVLATLYRTETDALLFTQPFGVDPLLVPPGLAPRDLWYKLLQMVTNQGHLRAMVEAARKSHPNNPLVSFLDALLQDRSAPVSAEPVPGSAGSGMF